MTLFPENRVANEMIQIKSFVLFSVNEPVHDKNYNNTCVTMEGSDQPVHLRSLFTVFTDCTCLLKPPGYPKRDKRESLPYWVDV